MGGDAIHIVEVGPRDGLQSIAGLVPTEAKVAFVEALADAGLEEIEVSSFVSARWVPQLADAEEVFRRIRRRAGVTYMALVPNEKGLDRALGAGVDKVAVFTAATETFTRRNVNASIEESLARFRPVVARAGVPVRGYVSVAFHCPYEGRVAPGAVGRVVEELMEMGCAEVSLGDTVGRASPDDVRALIPEVLRICGPDRVALHLHDTLGVALRNAEAGLELGIRRFDASAGGIGGCPYAPGSTGNVATELLVRAFPGRTGVDGAAVVRAAAAVRASMAAVG